MDCHIPQAFLARMSSLLQAEYSAFLETYNQPRLHGLRVNTLKIPVADFIKIAPCALEPIPWVQEGFYYSEEARPGKHPFHAAGLYYIQEPSAMAVAPLLAPKPGECVLDLAAAPGGKATQLAAFLQGQGLLVANEIHPGRAKILSENMERCSVRNAVVTNETPQRLSKFFPEFFDRILLDAPCSGEGMFRKDTVACQEWREDSPEFCANRQWDIIVEAEKMLKPGGLLIYSTCTFAPQENEQLISRVLANYPGLEIVPVKAEHGFKPAVPEWGGACQELVGAIRLWPQHIKGEGHFLALLRKKGQYTPKKKIPCGQGRIEEKIKEFTVFAEEYLTFTPTGRYYLYGDHLYLLPLEIEDIKGLKVLRPGWHLGTFYKRRFEPSHALALSLKAEDVKYRANFPANTAEVIKYLQGEALPFTGEKGWTLVTVDGYSLGWGKQSDGFLKNHYPKGLRW